MAMVAVVAVDTVAAAWTMLLLLLLLLLLRGERQHLAGVCSFVVPSGSRGCRRRLVRRRTEDGRARGCAGPLHARVRIAVDIGPHTRPLGGEDEGEEWK